METEVTNKTEGPLQVVLSPLHLDTIALLCQKLHK